jgi:hypothetical protein
MFWYDSVRIVRASSEAQQGSASLNIVARSHAESKRVVGAVSKMLALLVDGLARVGVEVVAALALVLLWHPCAWCKTRSSRGLLCVVRQCL